MASRLQSRGTPDASPSSKSSSLHPPRTSSMTPTTSPRRVTAQQSNDDDEAGLIDLDEALLPRSSSMPSFPSSTYTVAHQADDDKASLIDLDAALIPNTLFSASTPTGPSAPSTLLSPIPQSPSPSTFASPGGATVPPIHPPHFPKPSHSYKLSPSYTPSHSSSSRPSPSKASRPARPFTEEDMTVASFPGPTGRGQIVRGGLQVLAWKRWECCKCAAETHWERSVCSNLRCERERCGWCKVLSSRANGRG
jgi:hypothetical protein